MTELITKAQAGDKEAKDQLVLDNRGLVYSIAKRYQGRGYELEDIVSLGIIGLIKAINNFKCEFGVMFSTYAVPMINGEIKRFLRDDGIIKVSRNLKENAWKINSFRDSFVKVNGREPTVKELAAVTGIEEEEIAFACEATQTVESIYQSTYSSDGSEIYLIDQISGKENEKDKLLDKMLVDSLLDELDDFERKLITLRYYEEKTQTEVAGVMGLSQVQVSRLEKKIIIKLRKYVIQ